MINTGRKDSGFTMIELLLYTMLTAALLGMVAVFFTVITQARIKNGAISEVEQQGAAALRIITQELRSAEEVIIPVTGDNATSLTYDDYASGSPYNVVNLSSGVLQLKRGNAAAVALTNGNVTVSNLNFRNVGRAGTAGAIRIEMTVAFSNPSGRADYAFERNFYATAALRPPYLPIP